MTACWEPTFPKTAKKSEPAAGSGQTAGRAGDTSLVQRRAASTACCRLPANKINVRVCVPAHGCCEIDALC
jgi:hypothetical protein